MLLQSIDVLPRRVLGNKAIIVDRVDVFLFGYLIQQNQRRQRSYETATIHGISNQPYLNREGKGSWEPPYHVSEASAGRVLEGDTPGLVAKYALDVVPVEDFIVKPFWYFNLARGIPILNHD